MEAHLIDTTDRTFWNDWLVFV